ncbi:hypothetical protein [Hymenobacter persicinus]|uniref:DUF481 domain-containing protein n=1 Tax=Hymenobacter persicinus TaxID=2025506 RepID=A0A4Q5LFC4_9BACT|nr:hypothetical protein [Hymenobacter persicinus]RYU81845.1 hypothetical protein EWM57_05545 [Hymenobacter persicinus]
MSELYFVGNGDIQTGFTNAKKEIAANTGLGILFWRIWPNWELQLDAKVNVASTVDTLTNERVNGLVQNNRVYGRSVLVPGFSRQSTVVHALWYRTKAAKPLYGFISGFEFRVAASNNVWGYFENQQIITAKDTSTVRRNTFIDVSNLGGRFGAFYEFVDEDQRRLNGNSVRLGLNVIFRSIQGDIGRHTDAVRSLRRDFLLTSNTIHVGFEPVLTFRLKNIQAEASVPYLFAGSSNTVPGLSGAQFITSISFVGGFPVKME